MHESIDSLSHSYFMLFVKYSKSLNNLSYFKRHYGFRIKLINYIPIEFQKVLQKSHYS